MSRSTRQSSTVMASGWFGARTVKRDLPPNRREMGDPSNTNSLKKLTVTSTSTVVSCDHPSPGLPLRSALPLEIAQFPEQVPERRGTYEWLQHRICKVHTPGIHTSPRARRRGSVALLVGRDGAALARTTKDFSLDKGGTWDSGETAGAEKLAVDEAGGKGSEAGVAPAATV